MARGSLENLLLYGGGFYIAYNILQSWGIIGISCDPSICTAQCPRGPKYNRSWFIETCMPNYVDCGWFFPECCCLSASTASMHDWKPLTDEQIKDIKLLIER